MRLEVVEGRACGDCSICCKVMKIAEIDKTEGLWCGHCRPGEGCAIYDSRPGECRAFLCGWLTNPELGDEWKPNRARIVVTLEGEGRMVAAHVDPSQPDAWRRQPHYGKLKQWARLADASDRLVIVRIGGRAVVVFADREVDLGLMAEGDRIATTRRVTPQGFVRDARRVGKDDPSPVGFA